MRNASGNTTAPTEVSNRTNTGAIYNSNNQLLKLSIPDGGKTATRKPKTPMKPSDESPPSGPHIPFIAVCQIIANGADAHLRHAHLIQQVVTASGNAVTVSDAKTALERTIYWIDNMRGAEVLVPDLPEKGEWKMIHENLRNLREGIQRLLAQMGEN